MNIRLLALTCMALLAIGCGAQQSSDTASKTHSVELVDGDIIATFKHRHEAMRKAMDSGDTELAEKISAETNAWLETLSDEEQTLISKSLTK